MAAGGPPTMLLDNLIQAMYDLYARYKTGNLIPKLYLQWFEHNEKGNFSPH
jgi:hypothetical protein